MPSDHQLVPPKAPARTAAEVVAMPRWRAGTHMRNRRAMYRHAAHVCDRLAQSAARGAADLARLAEVAILTSDALLWDSIRQDCYRSMVQHRAMAAEALAAEQKRMREHRQRKMQVLRRRYA